MGRLSFSTAEIAELRRLLVELRRADRDRQKAIRAKIRRVGFNISDVSHDAGGFTATDFDALIRRGVITERNESDVAELPTRPSRASDDPAASAAEGSVSAIPTLWTTSGLEVVGFAPWVTFADLEAALPSIPVGAAGVYVVHRGQTAEPDWLVPSPVGDTWRGDPTVSTEALRANWVPAATVVYIGKAKQRQLRNRLRAYLRFGQGRGGRHWGGRLIWQLEAAWELRVAWRIEPSRDALDVERDLLSAFRIAHGGRPPFANNPDRLGR